MTQMAPLLYPITPVHLHPGRPLTGDLAAQRSFAIGLPASTLKTGTIIKKINGRPAKQEYLRILGWPDNVINEYHPKRTFFILPSFEKNGSLYPEITGIFYGDYIIVGRRIENNIQQKNRRSILHEIS